MKILCLGDSNTWGYIPGSLNKNTNTYERYPKADRWCGILSSLLPDHEIIEEGLCGRTTNCDDSEWPNRNCFKQLSVILETHMPIDFLIIMLGTNDLKHRMNRSAIEISQSLSHLITQAKTGGYLGSSETKIFLIIPPLIKDDNIFDGEFRGASEKSKVLAEEIPKLKNDYTYIIDASNITTSNVDKLHFDRTGHMKLAHVIKSQFDLIYKLENKEISNQCKI